MAEFESAESGASLTYPQQAGAIRKNSYLNINDRPCKEMKSTNRDGKVKGKKNGKDKQTRVGDEAPKHTCHICNRSFTYHGLQSMDCRATCVAIETSDLPAYHYA